MRLIQDQGFERAAIQGETIFQVGPSWAAGILIEETSSDKACRKSRTSAHDRQDSYILRLVDSPRSET